MMKLKHGWLRALAGLAMAGTAAGASAGIVIDGAINDWADVSSLPISDQGQSHDSPLGAIQAMKVTADDDFIYALIVFATPRPFDPQSHQGQLKGGVWEDFGYLEIDANSDGQWDWRAQMMHGKRYGLNNLAVLRRAGAGGQIFLQPEGNKDYVPLGPRAFFTPDGKAVEMRVPRIPLGLGEGQILFRGAVRYRDTVDGTGQWVTETFPGGGQWAGLRLGAIRAAMAPKPGEAPVAGTPNRQLEPVTIREDFKTASDTERPKSPYVIPQAKGAITINPRGKNKPNDEPIRRQGPIIPTFVIDAQGSQTDARPPENVPSMLGPEPPQAGAQELPAPTPGPAPAPKPKAKKK